MDLAPKFGQKLYVPALFDLNNNDYRSSTVMIDTGADLSICSFAYIKDLFPYYDETDWNDFLEPTKISLQSYTGHNIPILGTINFNIKFLHKDKPQALKIYIVKFKSRVKKIIFGGIVVLTYKSIELAHFYNFFQIVLRKLGITYGAKYPTVTIEILKKLACILKLSIYLHRKWK